MTPGLAAALTPKDWTPRQLDRREHAPRTRVVRARLHLPRPHQRHAVG